MESEALIPPPFVFKAVRVCLGDVRNLSVPSCWHWMLKGTSFPAFNMFVSPLSVDTGCLDNDLWYTNGLFGF